MIRTSIAALLLFVLCACVSGTSRENSRKSGPMVNRKQHGLWTYRYENGNTQAVGNYNQDRQVGRWSYFYPDAAKQWEVGFAAEQFDGPSQWWWPTGKAQGYGVFS